MENKFELVNYAIAESAVLGAPVDGHLACPDCKGCGMVPSALTLTSTDRRQTHGLKDDWRLTPIRIGVDFCKTCKGEGRAMR